LLSGRASRPSALPPADGVPNVRIGLLGDLRLCRRRFWHFCKYSLGKLYDRSAAAAAAKARGVVIGGMRDKSLEAAGRGARAGRSTA